MNSPAKSTTIGVNARLLLPGRLEGLGWYTSELLRRLVRLRPETRWIFYFDRPFAAEFLFESNVEGVKVSPPARHPLLWHVWFTCTLPRQVRRDRCDVFVSLEGLSPLGLQVPMVSVIHDLGFVHDAKHLPLSSRKYYDYHFRRVVNEAEVLGTISEWSKRDIVARYGAKAEHAFIVPNASRDGFTRSDDSVQKEYRERFTQGSSYFVHVGLLQPRKNISRLLLAYQQYRSSGGKLKLVMVGRNGWSMTEMQETLRSMTCAEDVVFTGYVEDNELRRIVSSARALVFVPTYEGFGVPMIEAMACDIPVLASSVASLPEVGGDAAYYVNPFDINDIAKGLIEIEQNESLRAALIENGRRQVRQYSWDKSARYVDEMISEALLSARPRFQE